MRISRAGMVTFLAALGVLAGVPAAHAAAGDLDQGFGSGGIVTTSYNGPFPADAALRPDGRIVVIAGFDNDPSATEAFGVLRYQAATELWTPASVTAGVLARRSPTSSTRPATWLSSRTARSWW